MYCNNCDSEAVKKYKTDNGLYFHLCHTCSEAFELGQVNSDKAVVDIDEEEKPSCTEAV